VGITASHLRCGYSATIAITRSTAWLRIQLQRRLPAATSTAMVDSINLPSTVGMPPEIGVPWPHVVTPPTSACSTKMEPRRSIDRAGPIFRPGVRAASAFDSPSLQGETAACRWAAPAQLVGGGSAAPRLVATVTRTEARRGRAGASAGRPPWSESSLQCEEKGE
jgi:hypothetical protein